MRGMSEEHIRCDTLADDDVIQEMDLKNLRSRRDALSEL
jgi:hypothetical protein